MTSAVTALGIGCFVTNSPHRLQPCGWLSTLFALCGSASRSIRSPAIASSAGSSVIAAVIATSTTSAAV
jgi:hypothetical protein